VAELNDEFELVPWYDPRAFPPSEHTLDSLLDQTTQSDFGIFILAADDLVDSKGVLSFAARDNVLFEAGLFFGARGKNGWFLFIPEVKGLRLASDLDGLTVLDLRRVTTNPLKKSA
jgi:predicted nucleotide-binding protein